MRRKGKIMSDKYLMSDDAEKHKVESQDIDVQNSFPVQLSPDQVENDIDRVVKEEIESKNYYTRSIASLDPLVTEVDIKFKSDVEKFTVEVLDVVTTEFLKDAAEEIGPPNPDEDAKQFVERGKNVIRNKLYKIFKLKS